MSKSTKSNYIILIIVIVIIISFIFLLNRFYKKHNYELFNNQNQIYANANTPINDPVYTQFYNNIKYDSPNKVMTYYRCKDKMLGKITKDIFDSNNIIQSNDNWNIYIPCGYNNVENELKTINISNNESLRKNKYIFGLNGCDSIASKNQIWASLLSCYGRKHASTLMPESYILGDPNEMMVFRKNFNPSGIDIYIMKKNLQRKEGLKLTKDFFEILEGTADDYRVVQKYITDLYLRVYIYDITFIN